MKLAVIAVLAACDRRAPITSCAQDLGGEYVAGERHWVILDRELLQIYPLFDDATTGALEVAPRAIELERLPDGTLGGEVKRRYMQGATACVAKLPFRIARCADNTLEVVHADPPPPLGFAPCQFGRAEPARVERWVRR